MNLPIGYFILGIFLTLLLSLVGIKAINKTFKNGITKIFWLVGGLILWNFYIYIMATSGLIADFSFPPKFFLTLILPAFIFTGVFIYLNRKNDWITNIPPHWLIYSQTYRILIEVLFVYSVAATILPPQVTIEGYNFDMIFAFSAPIIAFLVFQKKMFSIKAAILWNYLGLIVILSIICLFMTSIYKPELYATDIYISLKFTAYPYALVPAYLMPAAVFLHVLSIVQLNRLKNESSDG